MPFPRISKIRNDLSLHSSKSTYQPICIQPVIIVISDRPVLRRRERKGARTWPSFVKTRPQREYLYTTLEMAVEEQRGRGIIRFYEATMYFASRVTLEILRPPFNSLVQRISLAIVPRFRGRTFRRVCPFLFHVRAKRSENSVRGV